MTRSRRRKLERIHAPKHHVVRRNAIPVAATLLAAVPGAYAADEATESTGLAEVVVTAEKRVENLQNVPISVEVFDNKKLEQLSITNLDDYVKFSPSVSMVGSQGQGGNAQPGESHVYIRGVVNGGDGNHSGSQPTVGTYLDEMPVTTIDGTVDIHIYDVQRIEVLEGPQGTLFGASSESGTVRIISNKPELGKFSAGYDVGGNYVVDHTGAGYTLEGFVNIPISDWVAVRLVGWMSQDPGYISNVAGTNASACIYNGVRTFPTWSGQATATPMPCANPATAPIGAGSITNAPWLSNDYNTVITRGGRGALKFQVTDNWTVTPSVIAQNMSTKGFFAYDPNVGDLEVAHFGPENTTDNWYMTALTIEGKVHDFDIVNAAGFFKRNWHSLAEYSDYSEFYDRAYGSGAVWTGNNGQPIMPQEYVIGKNNFEKWSDEFRISTPADKPVKATVGFFIQRQVHDIYQQYTIPGYNNTTVNGGAFGQPSPNPAGFAQYYSIPNMDNTIWLTDEQRVDRDKAGFAQVQWDINPQWSAQVGYRFYHYDNSLVGFFGYSATYSGPKPNPNPPPATIPGTGVSNCSINHTGFPPYNPPIVGGSPCTNINFDVSNSGSVPKFTLDYKPTSDSLVYFTYSKGFRPGGVNRVGQANGQPVTYQPDYLQNYELGWKTQWANNRLRWNGALFWENWNDFQFSFLVPPSITAVGNGGDATIKGFENTLQFAATDQLMLSVNTTFLDPYLTQNYCGILGVTNCPTLTNSAAFYPGGAPGPYVWTGPLAPKGTNLPVAPKFKGNIVARYTLTPINDWSPFVQAAFVYQSQTSNIMIVPINNIVGNNPAYGLLDMSSGVDNGKFSVTLTVTNVTDKRAELTRFTEANQIADPQVYVLPSQPRTIGIKFAERF